MCLVFRQYQVTGAGHKVGRAVRGCLSPWAVLTNVGVAVNEMEAASRGFERRVDRM